MAAAAKAYSRHRFHPVLRIQAYNKKQNNNNRK
jgi:hypothetical protein